MPKREKKPVVLIVEDDEIILRALYLSFHEEKFTIATATDGEMAYNMTGRLKPDLVLLDLVLPKKSGFDYLRDIKASPEFKTLPVIVLSNLGGNENMEKAKSLGATDYYVKSNTDLSTLVEKAKHILKL